MAVRHHFAKWRTTAVPVVVATTGNASVGSVSAVSARRITSINSNSQCGLLGAVVSRKIRPTVVLAQSGVTNDVVARKVYSTASRVYSGSNGVSVHRKTSVSLVRGITGGTSQLVAKKRALPSSTVTIGVHSVSSESRISSSRGGLIGSGVSVGTSAKRSRVFALTSGSLTHSATPKKSTPTSIRSLGGSHPSAINRKSTATLGTAPVATHVRVVSIKNGVTNGRILIGFATDLIYRKSSVSQLSSYAGTSAAGLIRRGILVRGTSYTGGAVLLLPAKRATSAGYTVIGSALWFLGVKQVLSTGRSLSPAVTNVLARRVAPVALRGYCGSAGLVTPRHASQLQAVGALGLLGAVTGSKDAHLAVVCPVAGGSTSSHASERLTLSPSLALAALLGRGNKQTATAAHALAGMSAEGMFTHQAVVTLVCTSGEASRVFSGKHVSAASASTVQLSVHTLAGKQIASQGQSFSAATTFVVLRFLWLPRARLVHLIGVAQADVALLGESAAKTTVVGSHLAQDSVAALATSDVVTGDNVDADIVLLQ